MATILYCPLGKPERCDPLQVADLIKNGYSTSPEQSKKKCDIDTNESGKLSDAEVKAAAKNAGIKVGRKSIATLKKELGV
jgi:hypothetical protein